MKLAFSTNAFKKYRLEKSIEIIGNIGYEGVELLCDIPHAYPKNMNERSIQNLKFLVEKSKMKISNLNAFTLYAISDVYHPSWIEHNDNFRNIRVDHTIECIKMAKKLGAKNISTEPGGPIYENNGKLSNGEIKELKKKFFLGIEEVLPFAEKEKIKILIEPEPSLLLENSKDFLEFMKMFGPSDYLKLNFDIGHFYCVGENLEATIYKLADYIEHFHLEDIGEDRVHKHLIPGTGSIDFQSVFKAINEIGYRNFVTIELYPYQDNPKEAAEKSFGYIKKILSDI